MPVWLGLVGFVVIGTVGAWTVTHPNGGYRAVGGAGSGLSPSTRRSAGWVLIAFAVFLGALAVLEATG